MGRVVADHGLAADEADDCDPDEPALEVLVLVDEDEVDGVDAAGAAGVGAVDGPVLVASWEAEDFPFSVSAVAGLSDVSVPPGFILSE